MEAGKITGSTQIDCACPACNQVLPYPVVIPLPDRYGRELRKYLGFCPACNIGCETIQFRRDGRWVIHKYQVYLYVTKNVNEPCKPTGKWITLNDLPEPALIVTGPGGGFDKQVTPLLGKLPSALEWVCRTIECLMKHKGIKG